ncbi:GNAT family N-acetyltransferase [Cochlodiniinecator piscidefendens]|uniref:GNAT family N-acetyltransferase n=1 Tax=Cochlodiniinecator piscidefendens TaxID=2715756 RepID=UPI00140CE90C|nr:GNAT family protein [Cochlodiniinecator piscidefendens]
MKNNILAERPKLNWKTPARPDFDHLLGQYVRLERLSPDRHAADLHRANSADHGIWDYLPYGPFASAAAYHRWAREMAEGQDPVFFAIKSLQTGHFCGVTSYLRIAPEAGSIEVGHINFSPELQRTPAATEAMYLMMKWAFEAGYRRYEWKCDAANIGSRRAAQRYGFSYEGVFRQHLVVNDRNRDTAWFSILDGEWQALSEAFKTWLLPQNFDAQGHQIERLGDMTALVRSGSDPVLAR